MKTTLTNRSLALLFATAVLAVLSGARAEAALNIYAALKANGEAISGESSVERIGGIDVFKDHLELTAFTHEAFVPGVSSGQPTGRPTFTPIRFVKRMDNASPLLQRAFAANEAIEGAFKFFRPNPDTGLTEHYYSIELTRANIVAIRTWQANNLDPEGRNYPVMEEVSIMYGTVTFRDEIASRETVINTEQP